MAARSTRVIIHNETPQRLTKVSDQVEHGEWAGRRPPQVIDPFVTVTAGSSSAGFLTGTEARVTYVIGNNPSETWSMHWDNPFVGSNAYHTFTDPTHDAFWTAMPGNQATANFSLRPSRRVATDFLPSNDGFKFPNSWPNMPYSLPPLRGSVLDVKFGNAKSGLCGGMVFAALDYFNAGQQIPQQTTPPLGEGDPFFLYLVDRLFATFTGKSVTLMYALMEPAYPDGDEGFLSVIGLASGRAAVMAIEEFPIIRADIDAGRPSPMFLLTVRSLNPLDLGKCHQVLAYAYECRGHNVTLSVYDPNQPGRDDITLNFDKSDVSRRIVVQHNVAVRDEDGVSRRPILCFARLDYTPRIPIIQTGPRVTPLEVRTRNIRLEHGPSEVLERFELRRGRKLFDILPDCGQKEFDFEIVSQRIRSSIRATTRGYRTPVITWTVNDHPVPPGHSQLHLDRVDAAMGPVTASDPDAPEVIGPVTVSLSLGGNRLTLENVPTDGNYRLIVRVSCAEAGEAVSSRHDLDTGFYGAREIVPGLAEAIDRCFAEWIKKQRTEAPSEEAMVAAILAQLGRPLDPIWDPDPDLLWRPDEVALENPDELLFENVSAQVIPEAVTVDPGVETVTVDPGVETTNELRQRVATEGIFNVVEEAGPG
jgi:hypothetical protein